MIMSKMVGDNLFTIHYDNIRHYHVYKSGELYSKYWCSCVNAMNHVDNNNDSFSIDWRVCDE